jgi:hypothetical protein
METIQVDILNPKARKLLKDLAELNLISIREPSQDGLLKIVNKIRAKALKDPNPPTLEEITKEVELVRAERYAKSQKQGSH